MDWTNIIVALIELLGVCIVSVISFLLKKYILPCLEQHRLTEAAEIAVDAAEAIIGRGNGLIKWEKAEEYMRNSGWNIDTEAVIAALKAAWQKLDIKQVAAGVKPASEAEPKV